MKQAISLFGVIVLVAAFILVSLPAVSRGAETMEVAAAAICKNVSDRQPIDPGTRFPGAVGKLYCFSKIIDIAESTQVIHVWYYGDTERARVSLSVNPPAWRTYSSKIIQANEIGAWHVDILNAAGILLKTVNFEVTP